MTGYDVATVRGAFPALAEGAAHFDGPGGSQVPDVVAEAVGDTLRSAIANRGGVTAAERRAETIVVEARQAMADLVGGDPNGIVFGRSMTQLTYDFARTLARNWGPGDEVVVTRSTTTPTSGRGCRWRRRAARPCAGRSSTRRPACST